MDGRLELVVRTRHGRHTRRIRERGDFFVGLCICHGGQQRQTRCQIYVYNNSKHGVEKERTDEAGVGRSNHEYSRDTCIHSQPIMYAAPAAMRYIVVDSVIVCIK